jgi:hypothetical protein
MSIFIKDLNDSKKLDRTAMVGVCGGLSVGAITMTASQDQYVISGVNNGNITDSKYAFFCSTNSID